MQEPLQEDQRLPPTVAIQAHESTMREPTSAFERASPLFATQSARRPRRYPPQALQPPMQNHARVQTPPSPHSGGLDLTQLFEPTTREFGQLAEVRHQVTSKALEAAVRPVYEQKERDITDAPGLVGIGNKDSKLSAATPDSPHSAARHTYPPMISKTKWAEGSKPKRTGSCYCSAGVED